jgi:hypothetical protein
VTAAPDVSNATCQELPLARATLNVNAAMTVIPRIRIMSFIDMRSLPLGNGVPFAPRDGRT